MDDRAIDAALAACERELEAGRRPDLRALGFWRAVAAVKPQRDLVERYADRISQIDGAAFRRAVRFHTDASIGVVLLWLGFAAGVLLIGIAGSLEHPWREIILLAGAAALDGTTHGLAHFAVGTALGLRFTDWFVDLQKKQAPGLKIDYGTYLRTPPQRRAWMHASGAIATKLTPFLVALYALAIDVDTWAILVLVALGIVQILTDVLISVKASDWKKFRREMKLARGGRSPKPVGEI